MARFSPDLTGTRMSFTDEPHPVRCLRRGKEHARYYQSRLQAQSWREREDGSPYASVRPGLSSSNCQNGGHFPAGHAVARAAPMEMARCDDQVGGEASAWDATFMGPRPVTQYSSAWMTAASNRTSSLRYAAAQPELTDWDEDAAFDYQRKIAMPHYLAMQRVSSAQSKRSSPIAPRPEEVPWPVFAGSWDFWTTATQTADSGSTTSYYRTGDTTYYPKMSTPPKAKVYRLWMEKTPELQRLLQETAYMTMRNFATSLTTIGRELSSESILWLHDAGLRLSKVLRWFANDFDMWADEDGRPQVSYRHSYVKSQYRVSRSN
eukprot:TRINITY_DN71176_c0_g1_i2.p1 TRINITY_DN71176_c0_g1~~TRINITY_DN71176_c0_g1_i2.p1  ORF type:complete len:320 (-),score=12.52 TRINITY_DN71176_c0_g1_i2:210-1169(-)